MRRSKSQRPVLSSGVAATRRRLHCRRAGAAARRLLSVDENPRRHRHSAGLPRGDRASRRGAAVALVVARLSLAGADRPDRGGADRQPRHRGRGRPHRPGRRPGAHRRRAAAARRSTSMPARRARARARHRRHRRQRDADHGAQRSKRELRDRLLGQEPRAAARRRGERGREPLRPRGGRAHHAGDASPTPISWCSARRIACASRATTCAAPTRVLNADQAAPRRRHRLRSSTSRSRRAWSPPSAPPSRRSSRCCGRTWRRSRC